MRKSVFFLSETTRWPERAKGDYDETLHDRAVCAVVFRSGHAQGATLTYQDWTESYYDAGGSYHSPSQTNVTGVGTLSVPIPTDPTWPRKARRSPTTLRLPKYSTTLRTVAGYGSASTDYNGTLLGRISVVTGLSATFSNSFSDRVPIPDIEVGGSLQPFRSR